MTLRKFKIIAITFSTLLAVMAPFAIASTARAALFTNSANQACRGVALDGTDKCDDKASSKLDTLLGTALNLFSLVVGVLAVIMLIVSGLRMILSGGDSAQVTSARNSALYSLIGLGIVAMAQFIVRFVLEKV